jgi:23S rRNA (uracil1939-C5)-methyltransferase
MSGIPLKRGDLIEVTVERLAYGGDGIARHRGLALFIPLAAPGDQLRVRVNEIKKNYARASIEEILIPSPARRGPLCRYFGQCGGCQLQHINYDAQLEAKRAFVRDALNRVGRLGWTGEIEMISAAEFGYRARAQVKIERESDNEPRRIGFNRLSSHRVCDVTSCPVLVPELDLQLGAIRALLAREVKEGVREVEIAAGENGIAIQPELDERAQRIVERKVRGATYRYSASTFFQGNALLLDSLIETAISDYSGGLAVDLYAGAGLFTIQLAGRFDKVIGIEADKKAALFALQNIEINQRPNIEFHNTTVESWLMSATGRSAIDRPDLLLLDPPRAGAANAMAHIIDINPTYISYVSCDPNTLARDLRILAGSGYKIARITALDLFPQTYHVETVAALFRV